MRPEIQKAINNKEQRVERTLLSQLPTAKKSASRAGGENASDEIESVGGFAISTSFSAVAEVLAVLAVVVDDEPKKDMMRAAENQGCRDGIDTRLSGTGSESSAESNRVVSALRIIPKMESRTF